MNFLGSSQVLTKTRLIGEGPPGQLPLTKEDLLERPSGFVFGMTQNAGMGWDPSQLKRSEVLILSTHGGLQDADGAPIALGYHTGHWELQALVSRAAQTVKELGGIPYAAYCSDPCDGRTQGTPGMMDSLPYRNDAATVFRRLIRSLPTRNAVLGIATCDKGLPAMMLALAGSSQLPSILVPGGVTLPTRDAEDLGTVQSLGARFADGVISLEHAATMGCRACGSPGGGCQFLGTAATSQVVAEALGIALPHSALIPSGEPVWHELAVRSAHALENLRLQNRPLKEILTDRSIENAMLVHAAFGGSTNLLLHLPAIAHAAGLRIPDVADWQAASRATARLVDCLPNGPRNHPTAFVYMAGGVPEVMLHLRDQNLLHLDVLTVSGVTLGEVLAQWEESERRSVARDRLREVVGIDPSEVIRAPGESSKTSLGSTLVFPTGNLAPQGSVIKATAIDPSLLNEEGVFEREGPARVFTTEEAAIRAIKGRTSNPLQPGDMLVLIGSGPAGTGMEEIFQITAALKFIPWGKEITVLTDGRFSGVSTGPCIGHIGPEALAGGPISKVRDGDRIRVVVDRSKLEGKVDLVGTSRGRLDGEEAFRELAERPPHPDLAPRAGLPDDTRLWAALQEVSGGTWRGAIYDVERIISRLLDQQR
ncbi:MAG: YjhG/YagF family D-xylonate dehydratase [Acidobacteriota bacterium]|nr:MAG: YjhG/YagF family D-xylonate dehydratase [Acidobacteriota bacterium]